VRQFDYGDFYVWLIFISAFGCDTFAYLTGITIGRRKLVNSPSPSKSVEGVVGGIVGATFLGFVFGVVYALFIAVNGTWIIFIVFPVITLVGACFSIVGDMAASAIKRQIGIKDFSNIFPGHGGIVDRLDSVIIVAPMFYLFLNILSWLFA